MIELLFREEFGGMGGTFRPVLRIHAHGRAQSDGEALKYHSDSKYGYERF